MRVRKYLSIKNKLMLAFLVSVIPFLLLQSVNVRDKYDERRRSVLQSQTATAQAISAALDTFIVDALRTNEVVGLALTSKAFAAEEASQYLSLVRLQHPSTVYISFVSADGRVIAVDPPAYQNIEIASKSDIQAIIGGRDWAASDLEPGSDARGSIPVFAVSVGIRIDGILEGIVRTSISARSLGNLLPPATLGQSEAVITDSGGRVAFDSLHPDLAWDKRDWSGVGTVQAALSRQIGSSDGFMVPADGVRRLGSQVVVSSAGWSTGAYRPVYEAMAPVQASSLRDLVVLVVSLLATLTLVRILGILLTRPLLKLAAHAERLGRGELTQSIAIASSDETGQLAAVFNQMSRNLAGTIGELTQAKEEISRKTSQLQLLLSRTHHLQEEERKRIAFDMHDGVLQLLTAADYETQAANRSLTTNPEAASRRLATARQRISEATVEMRRVIFDLHPTHLETIGLVPALQKYAVRMEESSGLACKVVVKGSPLEIPDFMKVSIYRVVQEAAFNVTKHAAATEMQITIENGSKWLRVSVSDDGKGFSGGLPASGDGHLGLISMAERAEGMGGRLEIASSEQGTTVVLEVPVPNASEGGDRNGSD